AARAESEVGIFFPTVCGRCTLLLSFFFDALLAFFDALLASFFNGFSGGIIGVVCGKSAVNTSPRPPGDFPTSNHLETAALRSSIALHAARPMLVETATKTSATRPQARINTLLIRHVACSLVGLGRTDSSSAPSACRPVKARPAT